MHTGALAERSRVAAGRAGADSGRDADVPVASFDITGGCFLFGTDAVTLLMHSHIFRNPAGATRNPLAEFRSFLPSSFSAL